MANNRKRKFQAETATLNFPVKRSRNTGAAAEEREDVDSSGAGSDDIEMGEGDNIVEAAVNNDHHTDLEELESPWSLSRGTGHEDMSKWRHGVALDNTHDHTTWWKSRALPNKNLFKERQSKDHEKTSIKPKKSAAAVSKIRVKLKAQPEARTGVTTGANTTTRAGARASAIVNGNVEATNRRSTRASTRARSEAVRDSETELDDTFEI